VIENSESGTPNPKAAKRSKPIVHGPWNDIDDVGLFDDNGRPIILPEGNLPHPRLAPSQGYNGQPTTTQVPAGGGAKRQWKEFDSCNASNTGLGGLGLESRSEF
jgi:hypothetical protein